MALGENIQSADWKGEKHSPVIDAPASVAAGEPFDVQLTVGKEIPHPNTTEHFIAWIDLYFRPDKGKFIYHVSRATLQAHGESVKGANKGPVHAHPSVRFSIQVEEPGTLIASSYCNIHGLWESEHRIEIS